MLDLETRTAIFKLRAEGHQLRAIARDLHVSRNSVRAVLASGQAAVPSLVRPDAAVEHAARIAELYVICKGNLVRVFEKLADKGIDLPYSTLTAHARRVGLGHPKKTRDGEYDFGPGLEMQHDTSPHWVVVGGVRMRLQCASLVLAYSRIVFAQVYPSFSRFWAKVFLTDALSAIGASAARCVIDNTSVIVARGSGKLALMAPEMAAFSARFGFTFLAHELNDPDRKGRVERRFHFIENNFYPGRTFLSLDDLNAQFREWCNTVNARYRRHLQASARDLFLVERPHLRDLPLHIPEVYERVPRTPDDQGYVHYQTNRYSVPDEQLDRELFVQVFKDKIQVFDGLHFACEHVRLPDGACLQKSLPEHRHRPGVAKDRPSTLHEVALRADSEPMAALVEAVRRKHGGRAVRPLQKLHRLWLDLPAEPLRKAIEHALAHGLVDVERIETIALRNVTGDYFRLPTDHTEDDE
mgnify:CR=1 FL=1